VAESATPASEFQRRQKPPISAADESIPFTKEALDRSVPERFEEIVRRLPDHIAIKFEDDLVTYARLNAGANRLARRLLTESGSQSEPVGVLLGRGSALPVAMLAILKAGKLFVPFDPSFPTSRLAATLKDSQARFLITDRRHVELAREVLSGDCRLVVDEPTERQTSEDDLRLTIASSSLACILYTSGSTGQPKGVVLDHRGLLHNAMLQGIVASVGVRDGVTLLTSGTANAISTTLFTLLGGATLFPFDVGKEGVSRMAQWLAREKISIALIASPLFRRFCESLRGEEERFPNIRLLRLTSESVYKPDVDLYKRHFSPTCTFVNGLNATETGPVAAWRMDHHTFITGNDVPVGHALPDKEILIVDDAGHQVGVNEVGEIAVRSRYLSRGYWCRPDLTQLRFRSEPDGGDERLYMTGDLGLILPDGRLVHKGRKDFRVKIRGYGVDVTEVQRELSAHPSIIETVVMPFKNEMGEFNLVAYFTTRTRPALNVSELRGFLRERLATYMIPSHFVALDTLPLTPYGKINRGALPLPDHSRPDLGTPHSLPRNTVEERLVQMWVKILGVQPIGTTDNFFDLGGDSLAAATMIADLNAEFDLDLVVGALVNAPTIERLAGHLESERHKRQHGHRYLLQLQPGTARRAIFFVPGGIGGDSEFFVYARLARHVGSQYPFYGLRARSAQGTESSQSSVMEMASDYVAAIRSVQPRGPYYVVGECAGGIVAYEIAQQLHGQREEIALLVLMDTPRPDFLLEVRRRLTRLFRPVLASPFARRLSAQWGQLRQRTMLGAASYLVEKSGKIFQGAGQAPPASSGPRIDRSIEYVQRSYSRAIYAYRPRPYPGRMTLLVHEESRRDDHRATLGWKNLVVGGIELHLLPGNHVTYIRDHVEAAAHQIRACVDRADAQPPESRTMERRDLPRSVTT